MANYLRILLLAFPKKTVLTKKKLISMVLINVLLIQCGCANARPNSETNLIDSNDKTNVSWAIAILWMLSWISTCSTVSIAIAYTGAATPKPAFTRRWIDYKRFSNACSQAPQCFKKRAREGRRSPCRWWNCDSPCLSNHYDRLLASWDAVYHWRVDFIRQYRKNWWVNKYERRRF